jgi:hypothetical protein
MISHRDVLLNRSLSHRVSQENHLEYHILSTLYTEENSKPITWAPSPLVRVHIVSSQTTHPSHAHLSHTGAHNVPSSSQRGATHPSHGHTQLMGFLTPHRGTHHSFSVSERNHTPISWAHPTHGFSHRPTHLVCVLEDVSHSCNHQQAPLEKFTGRLV